MPSTITTGKPAIVAATLLAACLTAAGTPMPALAALTRGSFQVRYSAPTGGVNFISTFSPDDTYNIKAYPLEYILNGGQGAIPNER